MKKVLLTSAGFQNSKVGDTFTRLLEKSASDAKVLFIPTAATDDEAVLMLDKCKKELFQFGIKPENLFDYNLDYNLSINKALKFDAVYFAGGDPCYLLSRIKEMKFEVIINELIDKGKVYVGVSAGSVIAAPWMDLDNKTEPNRSLNLVNCFMHVHCNESNLAPYSSELFIAWLTDNQAILVTDNTVKIIE